MLDAIWNIILNFAPWLLLGAIIAGIIHVLLPANFVKRQFSGRFGVFKAVALGVPLPLCSCGVIPAGLGLKKDGASDGASIGFLISTPQTGVDSILVSASFLGWPFAFFKMASATITGIIGGLLADRFGTKSSLTNTTIQSETKIQKRSLRALIDHSVDLLRMIWRWIVIGILASAAITIFVPHEFFESLTAYGNFTAMLVVLAISLPLYVCATASVPIAAALVAGGFPTGAALVFLMAGPATNIATIGAIYRSFGLRTLVVYLLTIIIGSIGFGITFDFILNAGVIPPLVQHTHTSWWATASSILFLVLLAWFVFEDIRRLWTKLWHRSSSTNSTIEVNVQGMKCNGCVTRLEGVLQNAQGVESVKVTLEPARVVVHGSITKEKLQSLINSAGYKAT